MLVILATRGRVELDLSSQDSPKGFCNLGRVSGSGYLSHTSGQRYLTCNNAKSILTCTTVLPSIVLYHIVLSNTTLWYFTTRTHIIASL